MKKVLAIVLALAMVFCFAACGEKKQEEAKKDENALESNLVLYSTMTEGDVNALIECFNEVYPDVEVEVVSGTIGETTSRIRAEAADPQGDCVWGGFMDSDGDMYKDIFDTTWISKYENEKSQYPSPNGYYNMDHLSTICFCVNTNLEKELGLSITSYEDLLDPKLKGKIVFSDPNSSSAAWNNLCNIMSVYGVDTDAAWDYIQKLMPQLVVVNSSSVCFKGPMDGEYVVGLTYEDGAIKKIQEGATWLDVRYPDEGASASACGCGIIAGAKHPNAAKALIDFVNSAEGQTALSAKLQGTCRYTNDNYKLSSGALLKDSKDIKWVERPVKELAEKKADIIAKWNDFYAKVAK